MAGRRRSDRALRDKLRSPGRPGVARREDRLRFWALIATGLSSEDAAIGAGVSPPVGTRWFREAGGMPSSTFAPSSKPLSGHYLAFAEREEIALALAQGFGVREIARRLGRAASTVSRELRRNAATRSGGLEYRASTAQWHAERSARRPKRAKLAINAALRAYVQDRLAGQVVAQDGAAVRGPIVPWKGRRHGPRQKRRWGMAWSPEQIAQRLRHDFPGDDTMQISHEAIYQALYVQGRGGLGHELTACLRTGRALRVPRARARGRGKAFISPEVMISKRPAEADDRAVPGHWEGDLILGVQSSAIGTLVERTTRFTMLLHLPPMDGHGPGARVKNGPALAGHGAAAVRDAITRTITTLPEQLRRSLTWDQGAELSQHAQLRIETGVQNLLLRSAQSLAARDKREHQWVAAPILSEGDGPEHAQHRRACRRGGNAEWSTAQDAWMENTRRGFGRVHEIGAHCCCDDRLNSSCKRRRMEINPATEAEGALKPYSPETDRVQRSLIGIAKPAQRCEVVVDEIFAVVLEYKNLILNSDTGLRRPGIVGVLEKFR